MSDTSYSPRLRTGVLLSGSGTAGAYQAGALRAILEAGIKIDVIAAHGAGVLTALAASVDGGARVWDAAGPWTDPRLRRAYRWRAALRWAEVLTRLAGGHVTDEDFAAARAEFSEVELANLSLTIVAINGWNRMNVGFRIPPGMEG